MDEDQAVAILPVELPENWSRCEWLLGEALDIDPVRLDRLTRGAVAGELPEPRVYFRAKLALTPEQSDQVARYIERLRKDAA